MKPSSRHVKRVIPVRKAHCIHGRQRLHTAVGKVWLAKPLHGQRICFTHQTAQHICHCDSHDQLDVGTRTRIPRKGHHRAWAALRKHLQPLVEQRKRQETSERRRAFAPTVPGYNAGGYVVNGRAYSSYQYGGSTLSDTRLINSLPR